MQGLPAPQDFPAENGAYGSSWSFLRYWARSNGLLSAWPTFESWWRFISSGLVLWTFLKGSVRDTKPALTLFGS